MPAQDTAWLGAGMFPVAPNARAVDPDVAHAGGDLLGLLRGDRSRLERRSRFIARTEAGSGTTEVAGECSERGASRQSERRPTTIWCSRTAARSRPLARSRLAEVSTMK